MEKRTEEYQENRCDLKCCFSQDYIFLHKSDKKMEIKVEILSSSLTHKVRLSLAIVFLAESS